MSYDNMFWGCGNLSSAPAELPATNLSSQSYSYMFTDCSALTDAPKISATAIPSLGSNYPLAYMFDGCRNLSSIEVAFTSWNSATNNWVRNVSPTGTFYCPGELSARYGTSYIPTGWTRVTPFT